MQTLETILDIVRQTPSADNMQPWLFRIIDENSLEVICDKQKSVVTPLYNIGYFADYIALGMLLKNFEIVFRQYGITHEVSLKEDSKEWKAIIRIKNLNSVSFSSENQSRFAALTRRYTDRRCYQTQPIQEDIRLALRALAFQHGAKLFWKEGQTIRTNYATTLSLNDLLLWTNGHMRDNLIRMLRLDGNAYDDGLPLDSLGMKSSAEKTIFKKMIRLAQRYPWIWNLVAQGSRANTKKVITNSGAICLLTLPVNIAPRNSMEAYIEGGKIFQELWLDFTHHGISLQPMFAAIGLILNEEEGLGGLTPKEAVTRSKITTFLRARFPSIKSDTLIALFRVGYPQTEPLSPVTKKAVSSLLIKH